MKVTPELLRRYDRPGPRYTSYPTAVEMHAGVGEAAYAAHLERAAAGDEPLSLYLHLPFCAERCLYCGCHALSTPHREVATRYLDALLQELDLVAARLGGRRRLRQLHWGGGTPTFYPPAELRRLHAGIVERFAIEPDAEVAIEVDPRVTSAEQLGTLHELGFSRLSVGVQDLDPAVQWAIGRIQPFERVEEVVQEARRLGFASVNVDLVYGLPRQTVDGFRSTLERVLGLRPDRAAVYGYAHVPWMRPAQRRIEDADLPRPAERLALQATVVEAFRSAGYRAIGLDHFALPGDELALALERGTLWRSFMGYTVRAAPDTIACGTSAIAEVAGGLFQMDRKLGRWQKAVEAGRLAVERGVVLDRDDLLRRHVITSLMCRMRVDKADVESRFGIDFASTFAAELDDLLPLQADGLVELHPEAIVVSGEARLFVRNVARVFDAYRRAETASPERFSRVV